MRWKVSFVTKFIRWITRKKPERAIPIRQVVFGLLNQGFRPVQIQRDHPEIKPGTIMTYQTPKQATTAAAR